MPLTGPEHYRAAEKLLSRASFGRSESDAAPSLDPQTTALLVARAQVHATLAAGAASAERLADRYVGDGDHVNYWLDAVGRRAGRPSAEVITAYVHDDHDAAFDSSCQACVDEAADSVDVHVHDDQNAAFDPSCSECAEDGEWAAANALAEIRLHEEALSHYVGVFTVAEEIAPNHVLRWEALRILLRERNALLKARNGGAS